MGDILIRGISFKLKQALKRLAQQRDVSMNQMLVNILRQEIDRQDKSIDEETRRKEACRRLGEFREKMIQKYGIQHNSTKVIREFRDNWDDPESKERLRKKYFGEL